MRVAVLQFAPRLGEVAANIARADELLEEAGLFAPSVSPADIKAIRQPKVDLLVLPELAFSGYNFSSASQIRPFLEPTAGGPSAQWAARTAARLSCLVTVGYPETTPDPSSIPPRVLPGQHSPSSQAFNSSITVSPSGAVLAHHRKTHLYYTDATWAEPSPTGFACYDLPLSLSASVQPTTPSLKTSFAICMDLNPRFFSAPWAAYEAATSALDSGAQLLVANMAWLTRDAAAEVRQELREPSMHELGYWIERLKPLLAQGRPAAPGAEAERETLVVVANRVGTEPGACRACELDPAKRKGKSAGSQEARAAAAADVLGAEPVVEGVEGGWEPGEGPVVSEGAVYAGTSCVMALGGGRARVLGLLGKAEERVLVVDSDAEPLEVYSLRRRDESDSDG